MPDTRTLCRATLEQARVLVARDGQLVLGPWDPLPHVAGVAEWVSNALHEAISVAPEREMLYRLQPSGVEYVFSLDVDDGPLVYCALRYRAGAFTCPDCKLTSYHPQDVRNRYCGACHRFWEEG